MHILKILVGGHLKSLNCQGDIQKCKYCGEGDRGLKCWTDMEIFSNENTMGRGGGLKLLA
jgi:hypothetical protein